jgi:hypothetical protein
MGLINNPPPFGSRLSVVARSSTLVASPHLFVTNCPLPAVAAACRPLLASARIRKFEWTGGEIFDPELWWLNDAHTEVAPGPVEARIETADGRLFPLLVWDGGPLAANTNLAGPTLHWVLPRLEGERFTLVLATPARATLCAFVPVPKPDLLPLQAQR